MGYALGLGFLGAAPILTKLKKKRWAESSTQCPDDYNCVSSAYFLKYNCVSSAYFLK